MRYPMPLTDIFRNQHEHTDSDRLRRETDLATAPRAVREGRVFSLVVRRKPKQALVPVVISKIWYRQELEPDLAIRGLLNAWLTRLARIKAVGFAEGIVESTLEESDVESIHWVEYRTAVVE